MHPGLRTYWIMVCVNLHQEIAPTDDEEDRRPLVGYYRNYGVTAPSEEEACSIVESRVEDGSIRWHDTRVSVDVIARLDHAIVAMAKDWTSAGVWYVSGRVLFPRE